MIQADLSVILPEIILALYAMAALLGAVYTGKDKLASTLIWSTSALMVALAVWIGTSGSGANTAFGGMFVDDGFARFAKVVILLAASAVLVMGQEYMSRRGMLRFEYPILVALSAVGMMVMVSAGDLMSLYMGLELQSLALYVVASMRRDSVKSTGPASSILCWAHCLLVCCSTVLRWSMALPEQPSSQASLRSRSMAKSPLVCSLVWCC